ncbi:hypothetical protein GGG16DRAFT_118297 [Schizophyllum commune]
MEGHANGRAMVPPSAPGGSDGDGPWRRLLRFLKLLRLLLWLAADALGGGIASAGGPGVAAVAGAMVRALSAVVSETVLASLSAWVLLLLGL